MEVGVNVFFLQFIVYLDCMMLEEMQHCDVRHALTQRILSRLHWSKALTFTFFILTSSLFELVLPHFYLLHVLAVIARL